MTKIYTKTGDSGYTSTFKGNRVSKFSDRIEAIGSIDELNTWLGISRTEALLLNQNDVAHIFEELQHTIFEIGGILATEKYGENPHCQINFNDLTVELEQKIDHIQDQLPPLKYFILPGGSSLNCQIHMTRVACRRLERLMWAFHYNEERLPEEILIFINRLSDLLFVISRQVLIDQNLPEIKWVPGKQIKLSSTK